MDLQRLHRNPASHSGAPVPVEFARGKHWSDAAWLM
jgi:hypothetical protein